MGGNYSLRHRDHAPEIRYQGWIQDFLRDGANQYSGGCGPPLDKIHLEGGQNSLVNIVRPSPGQIHF